MAEDLKELADEVRAAQTAIQHWERELADRVREVAALDGFLLSTMTSILGTKEARVEAAVGRVAAMQAMLAKARGVLVTAEARLASAEAEARLEADAEVGHAMDLELAADAIRAAPHPASVDLEQLEADGDAARVALATTMEALQAAMGLLAATGVVLRGLDKGIEAVASGRDDQGVQGGLDGYREKARRLQAALDATGMAWSVGGADDEVFDFPAFVTQLSELQSLEDRRTRFEWIRDELRGLLEGFEGERRQRAAEVERLDAERRRLLEAQSG